jgi:hypothetical protein
MATIPQELFGPVETTLPSKRFIPHMDGTKPAKFASAAGAPTLEVGTPLGFDSVATGWKVWSGSENATHTVSAHATTPATAGTFTLTFNGETTAAIAFNATAAAVQAAIEALGSVDVGDVTVAATAGANLGVAAAVVTITFGGNLAGVDVNGSATMGGLTGNPHVFAQTVEGGGEATAKIRAFVYPLPVALSATGEVLGTIFIVGVLHRDDVIVPAGETQNSLDAALRDPDVRNAGLIVQGLDGVS